MKRLLSLIIALTSLQVAADENIEIEGLLSGNENYFAEVTDCTTGNKYTFGVMASAPYSKLLKTSDELIKKGTIIITVKGKIEGNNTLNSPVVLGIKNGSCKL